MLHTMFRVGDLYRSTSTRRSIPASKKPLP